MDPTGNGEESDSLSDFRRQDLEELIAILGDYKRKIEKISEAKSKATLSEEDAALEYLVEKMVLIKRKSFPDLPANGCSNNRVDDGDDSDSSNEDDASEREGLMSVRPSAESSEAGNSTKCTGIKVGAPDLEELISLLHDFLDLECSEDVVDLSQATPSSKMVSRVAAIEEILIEKTNSSHCLVPSPCSGGPCVENYRRDKSGICRKIVTIARLITNPKKDALKRK